ncbi:MAG: hypothetical protein IKW90_02795 [Lachnospiraceae bacterium]|nr:hypothetical protein [Lachnospiraceae bacterium]
MFDANDLMCLDTKYFQIINVNEYDVTVMSRNTGHYWYLHNPEYPKRGTVIIFHSHHADRTGRVRYHLHGKANTLRQAVKSIRGHDRWQMAGRPPKM